MRELRFCTDAGVEGQKVPSWSSPAAGQLRVRIMFRLLNNIPSVAGRSQSAGLPMEIPVVRPGLKLPSRTLLKLSSLIRDLPLSSLVLSTSFASEGIFNREEAPRNLVPHFRQRVAIFCK